MRNQQLVHLGRLLKEARESWDYFTTDEIVYQLEIGDAVAVHRGVFGAAERYLNGELWLEILIFEALPDALGDDQIVTHSPVVKVGITSGMNNLSSQKGLRKDTVLVEIDQSVEDTEYVRLRPIRTMVWLKTFEYTMRGRENFSENTLFARGLALILRACFVDGELHTFRILGNADFHGKCPSDVIQRGAEIRQHVSGNQTPRGGSDRADVIDVVNSLKVELADTYVLARCKEPLNAPIERIDMYIRPLQLRPGAISSCISSLCPASAPRDQNGQSIASGDTQDGARN